MPSLRAMVRRIVGRKGAFLIRKVLTSIAYGVGVVKPPNTYGKEEGITAITCTLNEADWVEPSMLSIRNIVDEYVVMDSSVDDTPDIIMRVAREHGLNVKLFKRPPGNLVKTRNEALKHVSHKWVLIWDADFIAKPEMETVLKNVLKELDGSKYNYLIYWPHIQLCGDLFHLCPPQNFIHIEHWMYTWSPYVKYEWVGKFDSLNAPPHVYRALLINKPLSFHLARVRSPERLAFNTIWWRFRDELNRIEGYENLLKAIKSKAIEVYGTDDLRKIGERIISDMVRNLPPYDKEVFGDYPPILKEYVRRRFGMKL